jgi:hypothetical protein
MKKFKKSRAVYASANLYKGIIHSYWLITPYDKKGREIPSSVQCAYNAEYYSSSSAMKMAAAL